MAGVHFLRRNMTLETLKTERSGSSIIVTLDRPERRNAVSLKMMEELVAALESAAADRDSRAVILTGGKDFFSAGRDLKESASMTGSEDREQARAAWRKVTDTIESLCRPVVAAIEGHCLTGGLELALACDFRIAGEGASFGITSARLGTIPGFGGTQRLPRTIGIDRALEMLFSAEPIGAREAERIGLVSRAVGRGEALDEALRMTAIYGERAPLSLALLKKVVRGGMEMDLASALDYEIVMGQTLLETSDRKEGLAAFLEKRKPRFRGE